MLCLRFEPGAAGWLAETDPLSYGYHPTPRYFFKKKGHYRPLFLYFRLFNTVDSKQMFHVKVCR